MAVIILVQVDATHEEASAWVNLFEPDINGTPHADPRLRLDACEHDDNDLNGLGVKKINILV